MQYQDYLIHLCNRNNIIIDEGIYSDSFDYLSINEGNCFRFEENLDNVIYLRNILKDFNFYLCGFFQDNFIYTINSKDYSFGLLVENNKETKRLCKLTKIANDSNKFNKIIKLENQLNEDV